MRSRPARKSWAGLAIQRSRRMAGSWSSGLSGFLGLPDSGNEINQLHLPESPSPRTAQLHFPQSDGYASDFAVDLSTPAYRDWL
jgi:hypothetical protein